MSTMNHLTCAQLLRVMLTAPNGAVPKFKANPSVARKLIKDGMATASGASLMITRSGRAAAEKPQEKTNA
jgi:hypothetical protein